MLQLVADNSLLRLLLLVLLFAIVAAAVYFIAQATSVRQLARRRLLEPAGSTPSAAMQGSLRSEGIQSAWLKLVNSIEKGGVSLVDTKDAALRQKLIAAGYPAPFAPRVYTLVRLVMVVGLPILVFLFFWSTGSSPSSTTAHPATSATPPRRRSSPPTSTRWSPARASTRPGGSCWSTG